MGKLGLSQILTANMGLIFHYDGVLRCHHADFSYFWFCFQRWLQHGLKYLLCYLEVPLSGFLNFWPISKNGRVGDLKLAPKWPERAVSCLLNHHHHQFKIKVMNTSLMLFVVAHIYPPVIGQCQKLNLGRSAHFLSQWLLRGWRNLQLLRSYRWSKVPVHFFKFLSTEVVACSKPPSRDHHCKVLQENLHNQKVRSIILSFY